MRTGYSAERLILTLWVGSLWAIGYLAVPVAFSTLETEIAGNYAGILFYAVNILGIGSALVLLVLRLLSLGIRRFHTLWRNGIIILMLALSLLFIVYIDPQMHAIKALEWRSDAALTAQFDFLHKLGESLYLFTSLLGLLLILTTDKQAEADGIR